MPWKTTEPVNERMKFVSQLLDGEERMADLCRAYGISRKTGYKYLNAFNESGPAGLYDASKAPGSSPHRTADSTVALLVAARKKHPTWGPKKLCAWLAKKHEGVRLPCPSTAGTILKRAGLVEPRRRRTPVATPTAGPLTQATQPNDVWCVDFKGEFRLGNGSLCYPLTITDLYSRYLVGCVAMEGTRWAPAQLAFREVFREFGLPSVIRSDNGTPFSSVGLLGLSRLSAWWLRLGIRSERIEPGHPEQNGQHERMHRTLKAEATRPAGQNLLQQQERLDHFREEFNLERPHEALGMQTPASRYLRSSRVLPDVLPELVYPCHDLVRRVTPCGSVKFGGARVFVSATLAGQLVGLRELDGGRWLVSFVDLDLGQLDLAQRHFAPAVTT